jgi:hypothetical protein
MTENKQESGLFNQPETLPVESPATEISKVLAEDEPDTRLAQLEKVADLAPRFEAAIRKILISCTFPQDWQQFGKEANAKACLSSAGAERVGKHFPIRFFEVAGRKEDFTDANGKAYRYVYEGKATLGDRVVFAQGNYSTRDKFLGFADEKWRPLEDINEGAIRNAAYHIFTGNAIKALLGLRGLPADAFKALMTASGQDAAKAGRHTYAEGARGGKTRGEDEKQQELAQICVDIASAGMFPTTTNGGKTYRLETAPDALVQMDIVDLAQEICKTISGFMGSDKKWVEGKPATQLKGKWLGRTLADAKKMVEESRKGGRP